MSGRLFAVITAIGGGCIGIPLYLLKSGNSESLKAQPSSQSIGLVSKSPVSSTTQNQKSFAQGTCSVISLPEDISGFFDEQKVDKSKHVTVDCSNTSVKSDYTQLPAKWVGWFPEFVFAEKSSTAVGQKVVINTETQQEEGRTGSYTEVTFSGEGLNSVFKGELTDIESKTLKRKVSLVKITGVGRRGSSSVYLFLPSLGNEKALD